MTMTEAFALMMGGFGWGLAYLHWRQRKQWQGLTRKAIDLNTQLLAANEALMGSLNRATSLLRDRGLLDEYLERQMYGATHSDPPSPGSVH